MTGWVGLSGDRPLEVRLGAVVGLIAIVWAVVVLDPFGPATIDPDASSSVLYFQRIVSGERLEAFVPTTPKPFLTLLFGLTWSVVHDWRPLVWETILAWGFAAGAASALVGRLAGFAGAAVNGSVAAVAAATFVGAALLTSSDLLLEVSRANSLVWALAFWSLAGLAITDDQPQPIAAGAWLLLAGLCRFETLALDVAALAVFIVATPGDRRSPPPGALAGVIVAFLALPIAMLHDWLLSGDPLYFLSVPGRYTEVFNPGLAPMDPIAFAGVVFARLAPEWPLLLLAAIGLIALARSRQLAALAGIQALGLGVVALLFLLAWRGTYISNRYYEPLDLALIAAAGVGVGWVAGVVLGRIPALGAPIALLAGAALGAALLWPALPWDRRAQTELGDVRLASAHIATALLPLDVVLHDLEPRPTQLLVPSRDVARVAVEMPASLRAIGNSYAALLADGPGALRIGQVVFHDAAADRPVALFRPLEIEGTAVVDGTTLERLPLDVPGTWLLRVTGGSR